MDSGTGMLIAVPAAVLGAAGFGLATAAQQRATKEVELAPTLSPRLLVELFGRPMWMLGLVATVAALLLQLVALAFGPIAVVQPLLVTGVAFAAGFSALMARRRPDILILLGALCCAAGLSAFLLLARPVPGGRREPRSRRRSPAGHRAGRARRRLPRLRGRGLAPSRVLALATATGVLYGVTAGLMKVVTGQLRVGWTEPFGHMALYVVCVIGPLGFLLSQNTFQQGKLMSPAVAVITSVDPVVGVLIGVGWLGEQLDTSPGMLAGECLAALTVVAGIVLITARGTHLLHRMEAMEAVGARHVGPAPG
ncbi:DMT family transporter [Pseudonocardia benzenivorans]